MLNFSKKIKKNTWRYYFTPVYQKYWWYDPQFLRYRVWMTEIGHYESFYALLPLPIKTKKIRILKKKKKITGDIIILYVHQKPQSYEVRFLRYRVSQTEFLSFWAIFALLLPLSPPNNPKNPKFEKMKKNAWRYYHFTHVYY